MFICQMPMAQQRQSTYLRWLNSCMLLLYQIIILLLIFLYFRRNKIRTVCVWNILSARNKHHQFWGKWKQSGINLCFQPCETPQTGHLISAGFRSEGPSGNITMSASLWRHLLDGAPRPISAAGGWELTVEIRPHWLRRHTVRVFARFRESIPQIICFSQWNKVGQGLCVTNVQWVWDVRWKCITRETQLYILLR